MKFIKIPSKVYDVMKWVLLILLPAVATLISALTAAWGWKIPLDAILATIAAVETFCGVVIGISTYNYNHAVITEGKENDIGEVKYDD